jgi:hypothetical protein
MRYWRVRLSVLFRVAYASLLPSIVTPSDLADGNAKLTLAEAVARVAGPGLAGGLVQLLSAPFAIIIDSASFVISAVSISAIRADEDVGRRPPSGGVWPEPCEGFSAVLSHALLRPLLVDTKS